MKRHEQDKFRLAVLVSHPIHYQVSLYRRIASHPMFDLTVYFFSDFGINQKADLEMGRSFNYGKSILEGYQSKFLRNYSPLPSLNSFYGLFNPGIVKELRKEKYDAVWVHGWANATAWWSFIFCFIAGIPVMVRGESVLLYHRPFWVRGLKKLLFTFLFRRVKAFLSIGRLNNEFYRVYGVKDEQLFSVPYAIDNEYFYNQYKMYYRQRESVKSDLGIPPEKPVILFVGKLVERKKPFDLLKAFETAGNEKAALVFIGEGGQKALLEEYARKNNIKGVYFMGFRSQEELPKFLSIADIFVLPSSQETWGMVINEAMNFKLPVIATDKVGAAYDLIRDSENGFVYKMGDIERLTDRISVLLNDPVMRGKMGERSLEIIAKWSYKEDMEGLLAAFEYLKSGDDNGI